LHKTRKSLVTATEVSSQEVSIARISICLILAEESAILNLNYERLSLL
jgi:hypothetical protein